LKEIVKSQQPIKVSSLPNSPEKKCTDALNPLECRTDEYCSQTGECLKGSPESLEGKYVLEFTGNRKPIFGNEQILQRLRDQLGEGKVSKYISKADMKQKAIPKPIKKEEKSSINTQKKMEDAYKTFKKCLENLK